MRLTTRILLLALALPIASLMVVGALAFGVARQALERDTVTRLVSTSLYKADEFERWLTDGGRQLRLLAARPSLQQSVAVLATQGLSAAEYRAARQSVLDAHLQPALAEMSFESLIVLRAGDGLIVASTDPDHEAKYRESETYFLEGLRRTYVEPVAYAVTEEQAVMHISTPMQDGAGRIIAVLAGHAKLAEMSRIMGQRSGLSASEETYLVNKFNFFSTDSRFEPGYALKKAVYTEGVDACLQHRDGVGSYVNYRGTPVIGAYRWLAGREACILTEVSQAEAFAPIGGLRNAIFGIGILIALIAAVAGGLLARGITARLHDLTHGAEEIGRGNLDLDLRGIATGRDAIGRLAAAFHHMTENLRMAREGTAHSQRLLLALGEAGQAVQRAHTPEAVFRTVGSEVVGLGYHAFVLTPAEDRTHLAVAYSTVRVGRPRPAGPALGPPVRGYRLQIAPGGVVARLLSESRTAFYPVAADAAADGFLDLNWTEAAPGVEQVIYAPWAVGDASRGLLGVGGVGLTEADAPAVAALAAQVGIALENVRLYREATARAAELEARVTQLKVLAVVGAIVNESSTVEEMLDRAINEALRLVGVESAAVFLISKETDEVELVASRGLPDDLVAASRRIELGSGIGGRVAQTGQPVVIGRASDYVGTVRDVLMHSNVESIMGVPLVGSQGLFGSLTLTSPEPHCFDGATQNLLIDLGRQIAIGVEKSQLQVETLARMAELKVAYRELSEAQDRVVRAEKLAMLGQLAGSVSHELRNPLGAIKNAAYFLNLALEHPDPDVREMLDLLQKEVATSDRIIGSLLDYARNRPPLPGPVRVNEVLADSLAHVALPESVAVLREWDPDLPIILADAGQLGQVFTNLIQNAVQAMPDGGRLTVATARDTDEDTKDTDQGADGWVVVSIADTGVGIPADHLTKLFEPLFSTRAKGIGLGLPIAKGLVESNGGTIEVRSEVGRGSTFTVRLPLSKGE